MIYRVRHRSIYTYRDTVDLSYHTLRLTPRVLPYQQVADPSIATEPAAGDLVQGIDYFGNKVTYLSLTASHDRLVVDSAARVEVVARAAIDPAATPPWETVRDQLGGGFPTEIEAAEFTQDSPLASVIDEVAAYAAPSFPAGRPIIAAVLDLTHRIYDEFAYDPTATVVATPLAEVMATRRGVCQDFAHVEIAALRSLGLAARYVGGYIRTYSPEGAPRLTGADGSHAWVAVFCPGIGWVDVDPTNDLVVGDEHITLGWGRDYGDVSPIRGVILGGGEHMPAVSVDVEPIDRPDGSS